jgi:hypothetical protein
MSRTGALATVLIAGFAVCLAAALWPEPQVPAAPGGPGSQAVLRPATPLPFQPGEELQYEVAWNGVTGATVRTRLSAAREDGSLCLVIAYDAQTVPAVEPLLHYRGTGKAVVDPQTLLPLRSEKATGQGDESKTTAVLFDRAAGVARIRTWRARDNRVKQKELPCSGTLDVPSAFLLLRAAPMALKETYTVRVLFGDKLYEAAVTPLRGERVPCPGGTCDATALELKIRDVTEEGREKAAKEPRTYQATAWVSSQSHVPVKLEAEAPIGRIQANLVHLSPARPLR